MIYVTGDTHGNFSPLLAGTLYGVSRDGEKTNRIQILLWEKIMRPL